MKPEIDFEKTFELLSKLKPLDEMIIMIKKMADHDGVDLKKLVTAISSYPDLERRFLLIANSIYYNIPQKVNNLQVAIAFLGIKETYYIVLSILVVENLSDDADTMAKEKWYRGFYTALNLKSLVKRYARYLDFDYFWPCAFLHDIGWLVYYKLYPNLFKKICAIAEQKKILFNSAAKEQRLPDSHYFAGILSTYWNLPDFVKNACQNHSLEVLQGVDNSNKSADFFKLLSIAALMTSMSMENLNNSVLHTIHVAIKKALKINPKELTLLISELKERKVEADLFIEKVF